MALFSHTCTLLFSAFKLVCIPSPYAPMGIIQLVLSLGELGVTYRSDPPWKTPLRGQQPPAVKAPSLVHLPIHDVDPDDARVHGVGVFPPRCLGYRLPRVSSEGGKCNFFFTDVTVNFESNGCSKKAKNF